MKRGNPRKRGRKVRLFLIRQWDGRQWVKVPDVDRYHHQGEAVWDAIVLERNHPGTPYMVFCPQEKRIVMVLNPQALARIA